MCLPTPNNRFIRMSFKLPRKCGQPLLPGLWFARAILAGLIFIQCSSAHLQSAPAIYRVEPYEWWIAHTLNPVRLLIRGADLTGSQVEVEGVGLQTGNVRVNPAGTYLFVDLRIGPEASPGYHQVRITTASGAATAPFTLLEPPRSEGRFQGFSPDDVIYLIMPDRFANGDLSNDDPAVSRGLYDRTKSRYYHGGDFEGIIKHLDYLKDLGVTALWLTPWYDNVNHLNLREKYTSDNQLHSKGEPITDYHGYGAVDFYGVEEHFGGFAKLEELVDAAHHAGLKIIQDQVANHTGPYHRWVTNPPTATWFNGTPEHHLSNNWQTWTLTVPNPPADQKKQTLEGWFIDLLPDLNQNDPDCSRYLIQNSLWWVGSTGIDGIRLDTLPYVPRTFWREWRAAMKAQYPGLTVVGEMFDGDVGKVSFFQGGRARFDGVDSGIESLFDFPLFYAIRKAFTQGGRLNELTNVLAQDARYVNPEMLVTFLGLHDVERFMSIRGADIAGLKLAFAFLLTTRGIPMIYYGDEIAMRGGRDPDNRRDFPGGFPGDPENAFQKTGRTAEQEEVFEHVRQLLQMRARLGSLRRGRLVNIAVTGSLYAYARVSAAETSFVVLNNSTNEQSVGINANTLGLSEGQVACDQLGKRDVRVKDGSLRLAAGPRAATIYVVKRGQEAEARASH